MLKTFTFTINPEANEAVFAGNMEITEALQILQQLTIAEMQRRAVEQARQTQPVNDKLGEGGD